MAIAPITPTPMDQLLGAPMAHLESPPEPPAATTPAWYNHIIGWMSWWFGHSRSEYQEMQQLFTSLRHQGVLTPVQQEELQTAYEKGTMHQLQLTTLLGAEKPEVALPLQQGNYLAAFRALELLAMKRCLEGHQIDWVAFFKVGDSPDTVIKELFYRLLTAQWLVREGLATDSFRISLEQGDARTFWGLLRARLAEVHEAGGGLARIQAAELLAKVEATHPVHVFELLGRYQQQEGYIAAIAAQVPHAAELQGTAAEDAAYRYFGAMLDLEAPHALSPTRYTAMYGSAVAAWRRIDGLRHTICNCDYSKVGGRWRGVVQTPLLEGPLPVGTPHKTLLFLTCTFGGGHMSATKALIGHAKAADYHVRVLNLALDVWGQVTSDWFYNTFLQMDCCSVIEWVKDHAPGPTVADHEAMRTQLRHALLKERPDLIVLTYAMPVRDVADVANELGIPVVHTATDFGLEGLERLQLPPHYTLAVPSDNPIIMESLGRDAQFVQDHVVVTGPPLRKEFLRTYTPQEVLALREQRGIAVDERVIFMATGARGLHTKLPQQLAQWADPPYKIRVIVACGSNGELLQELQQCKVVNPALVQLQPFGCLEAEAMAQWMHMAQLVVGKPGGQTVAEVMRVGVRFLGDQTSSRFTWERFNNDVITRLGSGDVLSDPGQLFDKVRTALDAPRPGVRLCDGDIAGRYAALFARAIGRAEADQALMTTRQQWNL